MSLNVRMLSRDRRAELLKVRSSAKSHACPNICIICSRPSQPLYELVAGKLSSSNPLGKILADFEKRFGVQIQFVLVSLAERLPRP